MLSPQNSRLFSASHLTIAITQQNTRRRTYRLFSFFSFSSLLLSQFLSYFPLIFTAPFFLNFLLFIFPFSLFSFFFNCFCLYFYLFISLLACFHFLSPFTLFSLVPIHFRPSFPSISYVLLSFSLLYYDHIYYLSFTHFFLILSYRPYELIYFFLLSVFIQSRPPKKITVIYE